MLSTTQNGETWVFHKERKEVIARNSFKSGWASQYRISQLVTRALTHDPVLKVVEYKDNIAIIVQYEHVSLERDEHQKVELKRDNHVDIVALHRANQWTWSLSTTRAQHLVAFYRSDLLSDLFLSLMSKNLHKLFVEDTGFDRNTFRAMSKNVESVNPSHQYHEEYSDHSYVTESSIRDVTPTHALIYACLVLEEDDRKTTELVDEDGSTYSTCTVKLAGVEFTLKTGGGELEVSHDEGRTHFGSWERNHYSL